MTTKFFCCSFLLFVAGDVIIQQFAEFVSVEARNESFLFCNMEAYNMQDDTIISPWLICDRSPQGPCFKGAAGVGCITKV